ncbi:MAG: outer membrane lipoprotein-sorting protein [Akkermansiaceae bacterium]
MKNSLLTLLTIIGLISSGTMVMADEAAERILEGVRLGTTLQNGKLEGHMRKNGNRTPLTLTMEGENISFQFFKDQKWQGFGMQLKEGKARLFETNNGVAKPLPSKKIGEHIFDSDLTYEDLSLRFLYWQDATIQGREKVKTQDAIKLRLNNPGNDGRYQIVYIWVHEKSGALMQVAGYSREGKLLKRFHVTDLMTVKGVQTLKKMNVETYKVGTSKVSGITYLEFKDATALKPKGL